MTLKRMCMEARGQMDSCKSGNCELPELTGVTGMAGGGPYQGCFNSGGRETPAGGHPAA